MARRASARMEEVTDLQAEGSPAAGLDLETGLIFTAFVALLVGLVVAQLCLKKYFAMGLLA